MQDFTVAQPVHDYRVLAERIRSAGLHQRRTARSIGMMTLAVGGYTGGWLALFAVGDSWACLAIAPVLAFLFTQVVFFGHDAGHQQISRSPRVNRIIGLVVGNTLTGLSFGWWVPKHNAHHLHPNVVGVDPDIGAGAVALSFTADIAHNRSRFGRYLARRQAWLFFPLLALEGLGLHISGVDFLVRRANRAAVVEGLLLAVHAAAYFTVVLLVLSPVRALAFVAVQQGLFGLYLGCTFAPNHKGMPILVDDADLGFVRRQVVTARNVSGGRGVAFVFGGLNYQIEHHLFPTMARRNLVRAQPIIKAFCAENEISYCEEGLVASYSHSLRFLNAVGSELSFQGSVVSTFDGPDVRNPNRVTDPMS